MDKKQKIILLAVVLALAAVFTVAAVLVLGGNTFVPPPFEPMAEKGVPTVTDDTLRYGSVSITADYAVGLCGNAVYGEGMLALYLTSPESNRFWMKAKIYDGDGRLLGESGLLRAGEYVKDIALSSAPSGDTLTVSVLAYEPDTYYSLGTAEITVSVKK